MTIFVFFDTLFVNFELLSKFSNVGFGSRFLENWEPNQASDWSMKEIWKLKKAKKITLVAKIRNSWKRQSISSALVFSLR